MGELLELAYYSKSDYNMTNLLLKAVFVLSLSLVAIAGTLLDVS